MDELSRLREENELLSAENARLGRAAAGTFDAAAAALVGKEQAARRRIGELEEELERVRAELRRVTEQLLVVGDERWEAIVRHRELSGKRSVRAAVAAETRLSRLLRRG
jgi:hypothetical protein